MKKPEKAEEKKDYEALYYKAMQENVLLKEKKISFNFNLDEILFLRSLMYEELIDMKFDLVSYDDDDNEENKKLGKELSKDVFLKSLIDEKRLLLEQIIKKLRFDI
jgi:hypothetical protein